MEHKHKATLSAGRFAIVTVLNAVITLAEIIGGLLAGSLGLISDGFHNMEDTLSIIISFVAHLISKKESNERQTFGYQRAEILAAFVNAAILIAITLVLVIESIKRLGHPQHINGGLMLVVSIIGLLANLFSMLLMLQGSHESLNIKATFLHMASDTLSSVGVIIAALLVKYLHWTWADPVITVLTALWIMKESLGVVKQTVLQQFPEVVGLHHLHVWRIDEHLIAFDAHINVKATETIPQLEDLYQRITDLLTKQYGIEHVTLQAECQTGLDETLIHHQDTSH